jgi:hypothetical protein
MDMDYQTPEQTGKVGQFVLFLAEDRLLNLCRPRFEVLPSFKHIIHEM